jgi:hypothetical protein
VSPKEFNLRSLNIISHTLISVYPPFITILISYLGYISFGPMFSVATVYIWYISLYELHITDVSSVAVNLCRNGADQLVLLGCRFEGRVVIFGTDLPSQLVSRGSQECDRG